MRKYTEHGLTVREELPPAGHVIVDEYNPCSSVTPWDYYGGKHQREYFKVLERAGIAAVLLRTVRTIDHPMGTGPRGAVRFGDNMTPGMYRVAVRSDQEAAALAAIAAHKAEIEEWLKDLTQPLPAACYD